MEIVKYMVHSKEAGNEVKLSFATLQEAIDYAKTVNGLLGIYQITKLDNNLLD